MPSRMLLLVLSVFVSSNCLPLVRCVSVLCVVWKLVLCGPLTDQPLIGVTFSGLVV